MKQSKMSQVKNASTKQDAIIDDISGVPNRVMLIKVLAKLNKKMDIENFDSFNDLKSLRFHLNPSGYITFSLQVPFMEVSGKSIKELYADVSFFFQNWPMI